MEYVQGETLRDVLRSGGRLLPERSLEITEGLLAALDYSHRHGIIHRDVKPGNVMLTTAGQVKVMDFGIARAVADSAATMTQTSAVLGTAQYLSPEQARGETVDARSDLYSSGCLLYELLTGRPPFTGDSPVAVAYQHVREYPVPPSQLDADLPAGLRRRRPHGPLQGPGRALPDRGRHAGRPRRGHDRATLAAAAVGVAAAAAVGVAARREPRQTRRSRSAPRPGRRYAAAQPPSRVGLVRPARDRVVAVLAGGRSAAAPASSAGAAAPRSASRTSPG